MRAWGASGADVKEKRRASNPGGGQQVQLTNNGEGRKCQNG